MTTGGESQAPLAGAERELVAALRRGDESAFNRLIDMYHASLLRLARSYVADLAVAEEIVQETWLGVLRGLERFEGRSSLKTWIYRILTNTAKKRGARERRTVPFSALLSADDGDDGVIAADRFRPADHMWAGHWGSPPTSWGSIPETQLLAGEARALIDATVATLPENQRQVITLRDIDGWSSDEVCNVLDITEVNQRVLLHRARAKVRQALEDYFDQTAER